MQSMPLKLINASNQSLLASSVKCCNRFWSRLVGLLGTHSLKEHEACWLIPCRSVHSFGMHYAIDVYFLNRDKRIVAIEQNLKPNRLTRTYWESYSVIELPASDRPKCRIGDKLSIEEMK